MCQYVWVIFLCACVSIHGLDLNEEAAGVSHLIEDEKEFDDGKL